MNKINMLIVTLFSSILFFSCSKDDGEVSVPISTLLAGTESKTWIMTANIINGQDAFSQQEKCFTDNHYVFHASGNLDMTEGATKCDAIDDQLIATISWTVNEEKKEITMSEVYKVLSLTEGKMVLEYIDAETNAKITMEKVN